MTSRISPSRAGCPALSESMTIRSRSLTAMSVPPPWVGRRGRPVHLNSLAEVERLPEARPGGRPPQSPILVAAEVGQHGEHPAVILRRRLQLELAEDDPDVALDGSFGEPEPIADRRVGTTLRHELEDLSFARREVVQRA